MNKWLFCLFLVFLPGIYTMSQVAINTDGSTPDNSAMLDVKSTSKGVLIPRITLAQRNAISSPAAGLLIFQSDNTPGYYYNSGSPSVPVWALVGNNAGTFSQWTSNGSSIYYNNGNVGIGTTSPSAKAEVISPSFNARLVAANQAIYGEHTVSGSYGWLGASNEGGYGYSYSGYGLRGNTSDGYAIHGTATGTGFASYFTGKSFVGGKLGINETNPNRSLYISDLQPGLAFPLKVENKHTVINEAAVGILFSTGGSGTNDRGKGAIAYQYTDTWNRGSLFFLQNQEANSNNPSLSNAVMSITNTGNVGIGISQPSGKLEVASNSGPNIIINDLTGGGDRPGIQFKNNSMHFISADDMSEEVFGFYSNFNSNRAYDAKLAIYGRATNSWDKYLGLKHDGTNGIIETDAGDIRLMPAGGVAINTVSAGAYKLNVNGDAYVSGSIKTVTKNGCLIIPPAAFSFLNNDDGYYNWGTSLLTYSSGSAQFLAPVYLPNNAVITSMGSFWMDVSTENATILMLRTELASGNNNEMAQSETYWSSSNRVGIYDNTIDYPQIDNQNYYYIIKIWLTSDIQFYGLKIVYTYDEIY